MDVADGDNEEDDSGGYKDKILHIDAPTCTVQWEITDGLMLHPRLGFTRTPVSCRGSIPSLCSWDADSSPEENCAAHFHTEFDRTGR